MEISLPIIPWLNPSNATSSFVVMISKYKRCLELSIILNSMLSSSLPFTLNSMRFKRGSQEKPLPRSSMNLLPASIFGNVEMDGGLPNSIIGWND